MYTCLVLLLGRQVNVQRSQTVGVFRTVFSTAPPLAGPQIDYVDPSPSNGDQRDYLIKYVIVIDFCCFSFININFSEYNDAVKSNFLRYKVVSIFSCLYALALSLIHTSVIVKCLHHHHHQIKHIYYKPGRQLDAATVGTTSVQSPGINNCPGLVICLISPNGD
jgi:hypothetical protein